MPTKRKTRRRVVSKKPRSKINNRKNRSALRKEGPKDFRTLLHDLEKRPFFELSPSDRAAVRRLESFFETKIEAWSFIPHPDAMNAVQSETQPLVRYIFTVDTLMASAYFAVQKFLRAQKVNVNSYFSGGWADFVCEAYLSEKQFNGLLVKLKDILTSAGAAKLVEGENVSELISIFRVTAPNILCGKEISTMARPLPDIIDEIKSDPVKFEIVLRNYQSEEARKHFSNGEKGVRSYVSRLRAGNAILCFKVVFDRSRRFDWDYTLLQRAKRTFHLSAKDMQRPQFRRPIVDLLEVNPIDIVDKEEGEVSHIFINEYSFPGERQDWKTLIYKNLGDNANLYTYPLEGTLNESPVYLSDVPEILDRADGYKEGEMEIGNVEHPLIKSPPYIKIGINSLSNHGVTFGMPGSGKTNADMLLVEQVAPKVPTVVILDGSQSVKGKLPVIGREISERIQQITLPDGITDEKIVATFEKILSHDGIYLVEPHRAMVPRSFTAVAKQIEAIPDVTVGNQSRTLRGLLLIEEANDVFGNTEQDRDERLRTLEMLLNKASRKGWSVWLSTQYPSHLGKDDEMRLRILHALKNRIIHSIGGEDDVGLILKTLEADGFTTEDVQYVGQSLKAMKMSKEKGGAVICGTENNDQGTHLRPIAVKVLKLPRGSS